jgi:hypothetical protein
MGGAMLLIIVSTFGTCVMARRTAKHFTAAVREGRKAEASELAAKKLRPYVDGSAEGGEDAEMLRLVRESSDETFAGFTGGITDGCFAGTMQIRGGARQVYVLVVVEDGAWRVEGVRTTPPAQRCNFSGD